MMRLLRILALCLSFAFSVSPANAQQTLERSPTTSRGLIRDTSALLAARDAAARAGADCYVTDAALRGRDSFGDPQYEVACRNGPGYLIIAGTNTIAHSCLLLASQNERLERERASTRQASACLLRANRNPVRHFASMAARAGLDCRVDEGRVVGLSPVGRPIYEIGCRQAVGGWIEQGSSGWLVTDCLEIRARGDLCQFTAGSEEIAAFRRWLQGSPAEACAPTQLRSMGRNAVGLGYYELTCSAGAAMVVSLDTGRRVTTVLSCTEAAHIGAGCRANARAPEE